MTAPSVVHRDGRVIVLGDIMMDTVIDCPRLGDANLSELPPPRLGGTAVLAATALRRVGLSVCVIGRVGDDVAGRSVVVALNELGAECVFSTAVNRETSRCIVVYGENHKRWMLVDAIGSNDYDLTAIDKCLGEARVGANDLIFVLMHALPRRGIAHMTSLLTACRKTGAGVLIDIVPHDIARWMKWNDLISLTKTGCFGIIVEYRTIQQLQSDVPYADGLHAGLKSKPSLDELEKISDDLRCRLLAVRYGEGQAGSQVIGHRLQGRFEVETEEDTGYAHLASSERLGFGDRLTARLVSRYGGLATGSTTSVRARSAATRVSSKRHEPR